MRSLSSILLEELSLARREEDGGPSWKEDEVEGAEVGTDEPCPSIYISGSEEDCARLDELESSLRLAGWA